MFFFCKSGEKYTKKSLHSLFQVPLLKSTTTEYHQQSKPSIPLSHNPLHRPWTGTTSNHRCIDNQAIAVTDKYKGIYPTHHGIQHQHTSQHSTLLCSHQKGMENSTFSDISTPEHEFGGTSLNSLQQHNSYFGNVLDITQPVLPVTINYPGIVKQMAINEPMVSMVTDNSISTKRLQHLPPMMQNIPSELQCVSSLFNNQISSIKETFQPQSYVLIPQTWDSKCTKDDYNQELQKSEEISPGFKNDLLQLQFDTLLASIPKNTADWETLHQLQNSFKLTAANIESQRQRISSNQQGENIYQCNKSYTRQHKELIIRTEKSLKIFHNKVKPQQKVSPSTEKTHERGSYMKDLIEKFAAKAHLLLKYKSTELPPQAVEIMNMWFQHHAEYPYPSAEAYKVMSIAGNITITQARKWFANKRIRSGFTKTLKLSKRSAEDSDSEQIAKRFKAAN